MKKNILSYSLCAILLLVSFSLPVSAASFGNRKSSGKDASKRESTKSVKNAKVSKERTVVSSVAVESGIDFSVLYEDGLSDAEKFEKAIQWGDCAWLYSYTRRTDADKALVAKAKSAIATYNTAGNVASFRTGKMSAQVRKVPKDVQEGVFKKPSEYLPSVVSALVGKGGSSLGNVKILHDWICDNISYDADMLFSGKISGQDWESVLKKKKAVCSGYTNLMNEMCRLAGIESIGISGWSKGFGYKGYLDDYTDHAWNAVHVGGRWYQLDCTWDAGIVEYKKFVKKYSTSWLFASPRVFLYSHLSEKDDLQYYAPVLTKEQFVKEPYVEPDFFDFGFAFKDPMPDYTTILTGACEYQLSLFGTGKAVMAQLLPVGGTAYLPQSVWVNRSGNTVSLGLDVPDKTKYTVCVFAYNTAETKWPFYFGISEFEGNLLPRAEALFAEKKVSEKELEHFKDSFYKEKDNGRYYLAEDQFAMERNNATDKIMHLLEMDPHRSNPILKFDIVSDGRYEGYGKNVVKYPLTYSAYNSATSTRLVSPLVSTLVAGNAIRFEIESSDYTALAIFDGVSQRGDLIPMTRDAKTKSFVLEYVVPEDSEQIVVYGSRNGRNYDGLWVYKVNH
ncbi:MAG: hypothetical protein IJ828_08065 [Treponema sp.]|nr:hypothetical protein [Treponema sp.]